MNTFLYPRTLTITRPKAQGNYGSVGYRGQRETDEGVIASGIPASVQQRGRGGLNATKLPGDAHQTNWRILIPLGAVADGLIKPRDILTDEFGNRYQTSDPYLTPLGYQLSCERLET